MSRISSVLGRPLFTQFNNPCNAADPILSVCVMMTPNFSFPNKIRILLEGVNRDIFVKVVFSLRMPKCTVCKGFSYWRQDCRGVPATSPWMDAVNEATAVSSPEIAPRGRQGPSAQLKIQIPFGRRQGKESAAGFLIGTLMQICNRWRFQAQKTEECCYS